MEVFSKEGLNPNEAVMLSDYNEAVRLISLENGGI